MGEKSAAPVGTAGQAGSVAGWEQRSVSRVLEAGRERVLARSRRFVDAAVELIASEGFEGLTLRAVLERTGLSRRAFYERFDGKEELVLAVFEQILKDAVSMYRHQLERVDDPLDRLRFVIESMVRGAQSDAGIRHAVAMSREHLRLSKARPDDLQEAIAPLVDLLAEQLSLGMQCGVVRPADPQELAMLVNNLVAATLHTSLLTTGGRREGAAEALWEFCLRAVRA